MENASKALLIAGGVLIAILVLTIGVYLVGKLGQAAETYVTELDTAELNKYNSNFEIFIGKKDVTAQEIVTLINIAQQKEQGTQIYLVLNNVDKNITDYDEDEKTNFLSINIVTHSINTTTGNEEIKNLYEYVSIGYDSEGKVNQIKFKKK